MRFDDFSEYFDKGLNQLDVKNRLYMLVNRDDLSLFPINEEYEHKLKTSIDIKLGYIFERILTRFLLVNGWEDYTAELKKHDKKLRPDLLIRKGKIIYVVEQKLRDSHDTTKRVGQIKNLIDKFKKVTKYFSKFTVKAVVFFVSSGITKNKDFYIKAIKQSKINAEVMYGKEFFKGLKISDSEWDDFIDNFKKWKKKFNVQKYFSLEQQSTEVVELLIANNFELLSHFLNKKKVADLFRLISPKKKILKLLISDVRIVNRAEIKKALEKLDKS